MPPEWADSEPVEFEPPEGDEPVIVYEQDGVVVSAFLTSHEPVEPNVGYRIEYDGKLIVLSGDTVWTSGLLENSRDADLLVAEAMNKGIVEQMEQVGADRGDEFVEITMHDIQDYHMDVSDVGALAQQAKIPGHMKQALHHEKCNWHIKPARPSIAASQS
jgi:ribonuclease Z